MRQGPIFIRERELAGWPVLLSYEPATFPVSEIRDVCGKGSIFPDIQATHGEWHARVRPARYGHCRQSVAPDISSHHMSRRGGTTLIRCPLHPPYRVQIFR